MTENAILRSVKYDDDDDGGGGGGEGMGKRRNNQGTGRGIDNKHPIKLTPMDTNLS